MAPDATSGDLAAPDGVPAYDSLAMRPAGASPRRRVRRARRRGVGLQPAAARRLRRPLPLAQTSFLYASDGSLITELHATEDRVVLRKGEMPPYLRDAVVAIEDRRFYYHHGVDGRAIARAAYVNAAEGEVVEGGSTITQQLVKNLYVGNADTLRRKLDEAALAWQLEDRLSRTRSSRKYLNTVYFGEGAYGVQAAAQTYFASTPRDLTLAQSALLAGLITAPEPLRSLRAAASAAYGRRNVVLRADARAGMIDEAELPARASASRSSSVGRERRALPLPLLRRLLQGWFLAQPGLRRDARRTGTSCCSPAACGSPPRSTPSSRATPNARCDRSSPIRATPTAR